MNSAKPTSHLSSNTASDRESKPEQVPFGSGSVQASKDKLLSDLKVVTDDAQTLMKDAMNSSAESLATMPLHLENKLNAVKASLERAKEAVAAKARDATAATEHYVQENPWRSIGIAVATSVIVSVWLSRSLTRRGDK